MQLTKEQSNKFYKFYTNLYGKIDVLPHISKAEEPKHKWLWRKCIRGMLGSKYSDTYCYRTWGKETLGTKVFNSLRFNYGPIIDDDSCKSD